MNVDVEEHLAEDAIPWSPQPREDPEQRVNDEAARAALNAMWWGLVLPLAVILLCVLMLIQGEGPRIDDLPKIAIMLFMVGLIVRHLGWKAEIDRERGTWAGKQTTVSLVGWFILLGLCWATQVLYAWETDNLFGKVLWSGVCPVLWVLATLLQRQILRRSTNEDLDSSA